MQRFVRISVSVLLISCATFTATYSVPSVSGESSSLALIGAKIYPSPTTTPIINGTVLIKNGRIVAVAEKTQIKIPRDATVIDCTGLTLVAGFWNSHVHFSESKWENAARLYAIEAPPVTWPVKGEAP